MTKEQYLKNLSVPAGIVDVVLDTDAFNEVDDLFAIAYLLASDHKLNTTAIYAAPFLNNLSVSAADGMEKSFTALHKILELSGRDIPTYRGSCSFLTDDETPVISDAAKDLVRRAKAYSPENPLYVIAIGAITNIASAILLEPKITENIVVVWLGGHAHHYHDTAEFNLRQDVPAARVVMGSGAPFVQLPCNGVVSSFTISKPELEYWLMGKNPVADHLANTAIRFAEDYAAGTPWTRPLWDVTAVAWLLNENEQYMFSRIEDLRLPNKDMQYDPPMSDHPIRYIYHIRRDKLMTELLQTLADGSHFCK